LRDSEAGRSMYLGGCQRDTGYRSRGREVKVFNNVPSTPSPRLSTVRRPQKLTKFPLLVDCKPEIIPSQNNVGR